MNRVASSCVDLNDQRPALSQAERQSRLVGRHRIAIACAADGDGGDGCVCVHMCACVCTCVRTGVRDAFAIYDINI